MILKLIYQLLTQKEIKFIKSLSRKKNRDYHNCFVVEDSDTLADLLIDSPEVAKINSNARKLLQPHIDVKW